MKTQTIPHMTRRRFLKGTFAMGGCVAVAYASHSLGLQTVQAAKPQHSVISTNPSRTSSLIRCTYNMNTRCMTAAKYQLVG